MRSAALLAGRALVAAMAVAGAQPSAAQPVRNARCVVPAKPGGGFDYTCKLTRSLMAGKPQGEVAVKLEYLPGGIGAVAFDRAVRERLADPGTLVAFSSGSLLNIAQGKFGPHPVGSVRWLAAVGSDHGVIAVRSRSPIASLADLKAELEKGTSGITFGAGGTVGSQDWIKAALLVKAAGRNHKSMRFVSFEGGGEALRALQEGHVDVYTGDASELRSLMAASAQQVKIIAVLSERRLGGAFARVPTAREQGFDLVWTTLRGVYMGPGVSDADYRSWVGAFDRALGSGAYAGMADENGMQPFVLTGNQLEALVHRQVEEYRVLARSLDLRVPGN